MTWELNRLTAIPVIIVLAPNHVRLTGIPAAIATIHLVTEE